MPVRVTLRELQERHRPALETYGKRRTFFWWWRWLWGYPIYNNQRIQNAKIDGKAIGVIKDQLAAYDKKPVVIKWLYRLFTPIEKQRSLLCYHALQKLSDENIQGRDEQYYYAMLKKHARKLRSTYLKPIAIAFENSLRPIEEPLYKRMHRPPSDELPRNPKPSKKHQHAVTPVGQVYDAKKDKELDITKATPDAKALYQQYQLDMQELDKFVGEIKQTLHQYKEDEMPEEKLKTYWQEKLKILDKFYRKFAAKYHPDKSSNILQDAKLANELFTSLRAKYESALSSWLDALNGNVDFEKEMQDLLREYDEVIRMMWEVIAETAEVLQETREVLQETREVLQERREILQKKQKTLQKQDEVIQKQDEIMQKQDELIKDQEEAIRTIKPQQEENKKRIAEYKEIMDEIRSELKKAQAEREKENPESDYAEDNDELGDSPHASPRHA